MVERLSFSRRMFLVMNYSLLIALALLCILPLIHVFALSFSSNTAATSGLVRLLPVDFTIKSYEFVLDRPNFYQAFLVTLKRVAVGLPINMLLTVLIAYPLSKEVSKFRMRTVYVWYFVFTMLFNGGLIPTYMTVSATGLLDSLWALILPGAVPVFNVVLLLNFFRGLPKELEEAALIDGASQWTTLWRIYVPLSAPALATICLFATVGHWNQWFDGLIYMNTPANYPLQSYLQTVIVGRDIALTSSTDLELLAKVSDRTIKAAQIFMGSLPILLVYPFLQRYFMKGIVLGSVKQ